MFAVIKAGGKQYRVAEDQVLKVEGIKGEPGTIVQLGDVIMLGGDTPQIGSPMIEGASVAAEILDHGRGPKVIAFKKRRRKNSRRKRGHRQDFVLIRISEILTEGAKPTKGPKPKPEAKAKPAEPAKTPRTSRRPRRKPPKSRPPRPSRRPRSPPPRERKSNGQARQNADSCAGGLQFAASINICVMIPSRNRGIKRAS